MSVLSRLVDMGLNTMFLYPHCVYAGSVNVCFKQTGGHGFEHYVLISSLCVCRVCECLF